MKRIIFCCLIFVSYNSFAQNGYTLEFESTILLSHDTIASIPVGTIKIKTFTVPAGMVLKINSGIISDIYFNTGAKISNNSLRVGSQYYLPPFLSYFNNDLSGIILHSGIIFGDGGGEKIGSIWVAENTTIELKFNNPIISSSGGIRNCWIGGVLFRKIPN